ncbi:MAG: SLC13/DASS family transporter [Clostridia bacterium]|nr:SLC13/DASS family transporter [Clostridia bacterium]
MSPAIITLIILAVAIVLFVSDKLPMGLVAFMVPVALYFTGVIEPDDIFSCIINSNVILILGMCVIGAAFFKTGMAYKTSQFLLRYTKSERGLILVVTLLSGVMSGFVSNSGTVAVLLPIVMGIAVSSGIKPIKLLIPLVVGATIGADITIIGSPGNLIAKNTIEEFSKGEMSVSFFEYAKIGIPMLIVVAVFLFFFGSKLINDRDAGDESTQNPDYSDVPRWHGILTIVVLALTVLGMVLTDYVDVLPPMHVTACCGAVVLVLFGVLSQKEAFASFETLTVFMLAFMMPLGTALNDTGAGKMIADAVVSVTGQSSPLIIMASLWLLTWALTQVMSNTAACTLLCPIAWTIAESIGADPRAVVIAVFIASSVAVCTPMAIPANSMIIGPGNVRFKDFIKPGLAVSAVCFVVSMILLPIFYPFY